MNRNELKIRRFLLMGTLVIALMGSGCASIPLYTTRPFQIDQDKFYGKIKTIALESLAVPENLENPEQVRAKFEPLISAKLREGGHRGRVLIY